eukprot:5346708-Prymnesium_polylepis.2
MGVDDAERAQRPRHAARVQLRVPVVRPRAAIEQLAHAPASRGETTTKAVNAAARGRVGLAGGARLRRQSLERLVHQEHVPHRRAPRRQRHPARERPQALDARARRAGQQREHLIGPAVAAAPRADRAARQSLGRHLHAHMRRLCVAQRRGPRRVWRCGDAVTSRVRTHRNQAAPAEERAVGAAAAAVLACGAAIAERPDALVQVGRVGLVQHRFRGAENLRRGGAASA